MGSSEAQLMRMQMISQHESQKEELDPNIEVRTVWSRVNKSQALPLFTLKLASKHSSI